MRKILRERSRNPNREVWESPSVYGGEDVKTNLNTAGISRERYFQLFDQV
ncbi:MAG: hypothetical protein GPJ27_07095 [Microcystis aeruginosa L111-01]|nr:hypothetical protein [Microcystis aeruginosa L111-01]NCR46745.1 hypothetical protein [Microcystis aeruginosa SX13-01]NCT53347.1 hypothetical protein [Microcystis aeruginosa G13-03]